MAKFLNTTGVSYHLEELIKGTKEKLVLISPYLQFTERIKEHLSNLIIQKKDVRIVFRENKLAVDENNWLEKQVGLRTSICKNLHAKCYLNENEAIITSMNLYEFSQQNNNEMGVYISKLQDPELYNSTFEEVNRLLTISEEIRITVHKVNPITEVKIPNKFTNKPIDSIVNSQHIGYCIRSGVKIPFNPEKPYSAEAYKSWSYYNNPDFGEAYCHFSGEAAKGETSLNKPILRKNWKKAKDFSEFK